MKNKINKLKQKSLLLASLSVLALASCTKSIPYDDIPRNNSAEKAEVSKSMIDEKAEYLMSTSMLNASRTSTDALPFSSGENKRVRLHISEKALEIYETESDQRYAANKANNKLVATMPIEHVQYQCAKDRYGECTNKEEESADIPLMQRSLIRINYGETRLTELNLLPIFISQTLGENCYTKVAGKMIASNIEADAINLTYENTFQTNVGCLEQFNKTSDATVTANFHISLVKVNNVISKDYKTVSYPEGSTDEQTFGFFTSKRNQLDVDNNNTDKSTIQIMNRWNPNRKVIDYYLSDEFAKPENKMVKDLTVETVANLNKGLAEAGVQFRVNLKDPEGKVPGDIRNSMIVLVEDPVAASIIGYGPQTEDPVTGEIISAKTVMFLGTIKKYIKYTYEEILREKRSDKTQVKMASTLKLSDQLKATVEALKASGKVKGATKLNETVLAKISGKSSFATKKAKQQQSLTLTAGKKAKISAAIKNYTATKNEEYSSKNVKSYLKYINQAKNCALGLDSQSGSVSEISQKLMSKFADDAKPWAKLSDDEKDKVIAIILPEIWVPTLIHEIGHNLGLRHNFAASEDKANYLSNDELQKIGSDHTIPFSSVMDYGNDLKTLPVLGKYDIAALRFGYLRQAEIISGDQSIVIEVPQTIEQSLHAFDGMNKSIRAKQNQLFNEGKIDEARALKEIGPKEYQYCTDEHLGINAGCKQFDLGSNYTEIAQNLIQDYEDAYTKRNLRDGRSSMSLYDDLTYASRINSIFRELRIMMEVVERVRIGNLAYFEENPDAWETDAGLKDLKQASLISGAFLTNVLLVPDTLCAVAKSDNPSEVAILASLESISSRALSCFDLELSADYLVVGQAGKMLNSKKDPESRNSYADQIDVRGIWLDKLLAIKHLTSRTVGIKTMDEHSDTFLNMSELRQGILDSVTGLMTNNVVNTIPFTLVDGSKVNFEVSYDMGDSQIVQAPIHPFIASAMGIRSVGKTPLQEVVASKMVSNANDPFHEHDEDKEIKSMFSVYKTRAVLDKPDVDGRSNIWVDTTLYVADKSNTLADETIKDMKTAQTIEAVPRARVIELFKAKVDQKPVSGDMTEAEKAVWALDEDAIVNYFDGIIKSSSFYKKLLEILPDAS